MKIYQVKYRDHAHGVLLSWHPNKSGAEKYAREQEVEDGADPAVVSVVDFPTGKSKVLAWLNINFRTLND